MNWFETTTPLIIGHRGASADAPENTLAAFVLAMAQGADGVEFDVQQTADHHLVIIHDDTVERTTNGQGTVTQMTLAALRQLDAGQGQTVPTLDELFETLGKRPLYNLEIKETSVADRGTETAVAACIQAHRLEKQLLVSSFSRPAVERARRHLPTSTPVAILRDVGGPRFFNLLLKREAEHPYFGLVDKSYMRYARRFGLRVHVWTVDDPAEARRLVDLGVHGLITNKPKFLREKLREGS